MSQLFDTETHAPKVLFLEPFWKRRHFWHTDRIASAGRASQKTSRPLVMMVLKSLSDSNIPFVHSFWVVSISFHNLKIISEITNCTFETKVLLQIQPKGSERNHWKFSGSARSLVIGRSHTVQVSMLSPTYVDPSWNLGHVSFTASKYLRLGK